MVYRVIPPVLNHHNFEVDSTESVWYKRGGCERCGTQILKLTPQSQYGIRFQRRLRRHTILKLTPQSQYGIVHNGEYTYSF